MRPIVGTMTRAAFEGRPAPYGAGKRQQSFGSKSSATQAVAFRLGRHWRRQDKGPRGQLLLHGRALGARMRPGPVLPQRRAAMAKLIRLRRWPEGAVLLGERDPDPRRLRYLRDFRSSASTEGPSASLPDYEGNQRPFRRLG